MGHELETELRVPAAKQESRTRWFWQQELLLKAIEIFNRKHDCYAGMNERWHNKGNEESVKSLNAFFIDAEGLQDKKANKSAAFELLNNGIAELSSFEINVIRTDSGGGYHGTVFLSEPILIEGNQENCITRHEAKIYLAKIKNWAKKHCNEKAHFDPAVYDLARIQRIPGTFNHKAGQLSFFIDSPKKTPTKKILEWLETLPAPAQVYEPALNAAPTITPKKCGFCEHALQNKIDAPNRYERLSSHMAAYVRALPNKMELHKKFQLVQDSSKPDLDTLASWDKKPSKFCCTALRHYAEANGYKKICEECLEAIAP